jgi:hypothetical protein
MDIGGTRHMIGSKDKSNSVLDDSGQRQRLPGLTFRSVILAVLSLGVVTYLIVYGYAFNLTTPIVPELVPSPPAFGILIILLLLTLVLGRFSKTFLISRQEMLVVYLSVAIGGLIPVHLFGQLSTLLGRWGFNLGMGMEEWTDIVGHLRGILVPTGNGVAEGFLLGNNTGVPWGAWILPLILWFLFFLAILAMCMFVVTLFRQRWDEHEHLVFPISTIPLLVLDYGDVVSSKDDKVGKNVLFWCGVAIPVLLTGLSILNRFISVIPTIPTSWLIGDFFEENSYFRSGLNMWPSLTFIINPIAIGLAYLLPGDLSFSAWFFFLVLKLTNIAAVIRGTEEVTWLFLKNHPYGAYLGLVVYLVWFNRMQIRQTFREAFTKSSENTTGASLSRISVWGFIVCAVLVIVFLNLLLGINLILSLAFVLLYLSAVIVFARVRAEAGVPSSVAIPHKIPAMLKEVFGSEKIGSVQLGRMGAMYSQTEFGSIGALTLEGFRTADKLNMKRTDVYWALGLGFTVAFAFSAISFLGLSYRYGVVMAASYLMNTATNSTEVLLKTAEGSLTGGYALISGAAIVSTLMFLRTKFMWWPFHPLGYLLGWQYDIASSYWSSFFIAWLFKIIILRYGGNYLHKRTLQFAYGLILGGVVMQFAGTAISFVLGAFM